MNPNFQQLMRDATRLTGTGRLQEATEAIQRALAAAGAPTATAPAAAVLPDLNVIDIDAVEVPDDAARPAAAPERFTSGRHTEAGLTRDFKLYLPPAPTHVGLPLVVMLHGCTQDPDDFAAGTGMNALAREQGFAVLYPAQAPDANPGRCWNWFKHNHQQAGRGEPAVLAGMTEAVRAEHGLDRRRVYVAGLSAGGAMAAVLAHAYPDRFAAAGVHSGLPAGAAKDMMSALAAMKDGPAGASPAPGAAALPLIVFHADDDTTVNPRNAEALLTAALAGRVTTAQRSSGATPAGRRYTHTRHVDAGGRCLAEEWRLHGGGHAWSGGHAAGTYTDPAGPDASRAMWRFFSEHPKPA